MPVNSDDDNLEILRAWDPVKLDYVKSCAEMVGVNQREYLRVFCVQVPNAADSEFTNFWHQHTQND